MPAYTPDSEVTLHIGEAGLKVILDAYKRTRPEEFRIVSAHYADGDPQTAPLMLNDDGAWLDYAIRINDITIDIAPPDPTLHNPIPPANGQFSLAARVSFEFRDFANTAAVFDFAIDVWVLAAPRMVKSGGNTFIGLDLVDLRLVGLSPAPFSDYLQYVLSLVVRQALGRLLIPTTFNAQDVLTLVTLDVGTKDDSIQVYGAIYRPSPGQG